MVVLLGSKRVKKGTCLHFEPNWEDRTRRRKQSHRGSCREAPSPSGCDARPRAVPGAGSTESTRAR